MKKIILIAMVMLVASSCTTEESQPKDEPKKETPKEPQEEVSAGDRPPYEQLYFMVSDANGVDLLNPNNANSLKDIKMFKTINGVETSTYNKDRDNPYGYIIRAPTSGTTEIKSKLLSTAWSTYIPPYCDEMSYDAANMLYDEDKKSNYYFTTSIVRIQWDETNSDVIKSELRDYVGDQIFTHKLWINGEFKHEFKNGDDFYIEKKVIK